MILETPKDGGVSGCVNGNIGKAVGIILNPKELPSSARIRMLEHPPHGILLNLQKHTLQKKLTGLEEFPVGTVPISPSLGNYFNINLPLINKNWYKLSWPDSESNLRVRRFGFKISPAFAFTDFKCQASTHSRLACNTLQCPGKGPPVSPGTSAYVMISRCVLLQGLLFLQPVTKSIRKDPCPALIAEQIRLRQMERETLLTRRKTIDQLMTDLTTLQRDINGQNKNYIWVKESLLHISQLICNLKKFQFDPINSPPKVATCIACLEICLSDDPQPRCYECLKDKVPALSPQTCISCSAPCPWVNSNNTRRNKSCDNCCKLKAAQSKKRRFSSLLKGTSNSKKTQPKHTSFNAFTKKTSTTTKFTLAPTLYLPTKKTIEKRCPGEHISIIALNGVYYSLRDFGAGGDCFFLSACGAINLLFPQIYYTNFTLRNAVCDWYLRRGQTSFHSVTPSEIILDNPHHIPSSWTWHEWAQYIRNPGTWGGETEVQAVNSILPEGVTLNIYQSSTGRISGTEHNAPNGTIILLYHSENHYQWMKPV